MRVSSAAIIGAGLSGLIAGRILAQNGITVTIFDKGRIAGGRMASRDRDENSFDYGAQYFTARDAKFRQFLTPLIRDKKVARWKGKFAQMTDDCLAEDTLSKFRYVGIPLMRTVAEEVAKTLDCRMSHRVTSVSRQNDGWFLDGEMGGEEATSSFRAGKYDFLVLNLPPLQAEAIHPHPKLTDRAFMPCCALLLTFAERIKLEFDGIKLDDKIISWVARDSSKPERPAGERWVIHASPDWSKEHYDWPSHEIEQELLERFATIFSINLSEPAFKKLHKWRFALPISPPEWGCVFDAESAVAYCGDWCMGAKVEGAFLSGVSVAEKILSYANQTRLSPAFAERFYL